MVDAASRLHTLAGKMLGAPLPIRIRAWDGSEAGPPDAPVLVVRHRRALRRILWRPSELGLARAWVAGELDVDGDLYGVLDTVGSLLWERDDSDDETSAGRSLFALLRNPEVRSAARELLDLAGPFPPPPPPREEVRRRTGLQHTLRRDKQAISHHYDVGNDFYSLVLGPSMVYSCAYWESPGQDGGLEKAQHDKLDLICRKLDLQPGQRLLDVGCGWGSLVLHAAREYGVQSVGVTLSHEQAAFARKRIAEEGLTDRIEVRVQDYRRIPDGPYDAISSVGLAEHVGTAVYREYADILYGLLKTGGRLLNHQIGRR
ncbi:MAG TPA: cyclopropane-fatty-acyl-phospholipid synthase family protein, partial [Streptomyces sp.]|nr:cyclopropane-fatty-acyl-phospholipid synthase family protein [Streptomyces sp.]